MDLARLPGGDLVAKGLLDLAASTPTIEALLVSIAALRLRNGGLNIKDPFADPEHRLYALLAAEDTDAAHSRYNALLRRLTAFESALESPSFRNRLTDVRHEEP